MRQKSTRSTRFALPHGVLGPAAWAGAAATSAAAAKTVAQPSFRPLLPLQLDVDLLAAWVIWPAIASARSWASPPSVSASSAVNFLPSDSWSRRRAANASSSVSDWPVCVACAVSASAIFGWTLA